MRLSILEMISTKLRTVFLVLICGMVPWILPTSKQPALYNYFADTRELLGVHNFCDVGSNIFFILASLASIYILNKSKFEPDLKIALYVFSSGVLMTGLGSGYYHLSPDDNSLVFDRIPMTLAFAGVLSASVYQITACRFSMYVVMAAGLIYGPISVLHWSSTGNITPYAFMQFGGLAWLIYVSTLLYKAPTALNWTALVVCYIAAKLAELFDAYIFHSLTSGCISGHTLKHIIAAFGILLLIRSTLKNSSNSGV